MDLWYCHLGLYCRDYDVDVDVDDDDIDDDNDDDVEIYDDYDDDNHVEVYPAGHAWIHYALHQLTDAG